MTYFDGQHWSVCRRCSRIQVVLFLPDRLGDLIPVCRDCHAVAQELLLLGKSVVKQQRIKKQGPGVDYAALLDFE